MNLFKKALYIYGYLSVVAILIGLALMGYTKYMDIETGLIYTVASLLAPIGLCMFGSILLAFITKELIDTLFNKESL